MCLFCILVDICFVRVNLQGHPVSITGRTTMRAPKGSSSPKVATQVQGKPRAVKWRAGGGGMVHHPVCVMSDHSV